MFYGLKCYKINVCIVFCNFVDRSFALYIILALPLVKPKHHYNMIITLLIGKMYFINITVLKEVILWMYAREVCLRYI